MLNNILVDSKPFVLLNHRWQAYEEHCIAPLWSCTGKCLSAMYLWQALSYFLIKKFFVNTAQHLSSCLLIVQLVTGTLTSSIPPTNPVLSLVMPRRRTHTSTRTQTCAQMQTLTQRGLIACLLYVCGWMYRNFETAQSKRQIPSW